MDYPQPDKSAIIWGDYIIFSASLCITAGISFYYGIVRRKNNTVEEYMLGGRNMQSFPVCMSNLASAVSSISLISFPSETYYYGAQLYFICAGEVLAYSLMYFFYLPVFYELGYMSLFEYLERRFSKLTRCLASSVYTITQILYLLAVVYASCSAVTEAIGIPFQIFTPLICIGCTLYTTVGGLRGVVWADTLQAMFMFMSVLIMIVIGLINVGGIGELIKISRNGGRLNLLNFDPSPLVRHSSWLLTLSTTLGTVFRTCTHPGVVQRYRSLATLSKAKQVVIATGLANTLIAFLFVTLGLVIYGAYHDCDPSMSKSLHDKEQLTSHFVIETGKKIPGITGLFLAGVLSAALSSMSTIMNSSSGTIFEDLIKPCLPMKKLSQEKTNLCIKLIVLIFGSIITIGVFCISTKGGLFQFYRTIISLTNGAIIFLFTFGLFYKTANTKGAVAGSLAGVAVTVWIGLGSQAAISSGKIKFIHKVVSIEGCIGNITETLGLNITTIGSYENSPPVIFDNDVPYPYRISFQLITFIGFAISCFVGCLFSNCFKNYKTINDNLLVPQIREKKNKLDKNKLLYNDEEMKELNVEQKYTINET